MYVGLVQVHVFKPTYMENSTDDYGSIHMYVYIQAFRMIGNGLKPGASEPVHLNTATANAS